MTLKPEVVAQLERVLAAVEPLPPRVVAPVWNKVLARAAINGFHDNSRRGGYTALQFAQPCWQRRHQNEFIP